MKIYLFIAFVCFYCSLNAQSVVIAADKTIIRITGLETPCLSEPREITSLSSFKGLVISDVKCKVTRYNCICIFKNGDAKQVRVNGDDIHEIIKLFNQLKKGDKVIFNNIYLMCSGDKVPHHVEYELSRIIK